jgi:hypothetical protein
MPQQKTPSLKTYFDEIEETNGDDECKAWLNRVFDLKAELADFVATRRAGGGSGKYIGFLKGSFNFSFRFSFKMEGRTPLFGSQNRDTRLQLIGTKRLRTRFRLWNISANTRIFLFLVFTAGA